MTARISLLLLLLPTAGCLTSSEFEQHRTGLESEIVELRNALDESELERESMSLRLSEFGDLKKALDDASEARHQLLARLEDLDRNQIRPLADGQTANKELLRDLNQVRINEIRGELSDLRARYEGLNQRMNEYQSATSTQELVRIQKELADLDGRVEVHHRLSESNTANIDQLNRSMDALTNDYNRQMRLLEQYLNAQFVPLAQELVGHIYSESRRLGESAEQLEELARKVDPYKFSHLVPKLETDVATKPPTPKDDRE